MKKLLVLIAFLLTGSSVCINESIPQTPANPQVKKQKKTSSLVPIVRSAGAIIYYLVTKVEFVGAVGTGAFFMAFKLIKNLYFSKVDASEFGVLKSDFDDFKKEFKTFKDESSKNHTDTITKMNGISDNVTNANTILQTALDKMMINQNTHANAFLEEIAKREKTNENTNNCLIKIEDNIVQVQNLLKNETDDRKKDTDDHKNSFEKANNLLGEIIKEIGELKKRDNDQHEVFTTYMNNGEKWRNNLQEEHNNLFKETKITNEKVGNLLIALENKVIPNNNSN